MASHPRDHYVHNGDVYIHDESYTQVNIGVRRRRSRFSYASYWIFMVWAFEFCFWVIVGFLGLAVLATLALGRLIGVPILRARHHSTWGDEFADAGAFLTQVFDTMTMRRSRAYE